MELHPTFPALDAPSRRKSTKDRGRLRVARAQAPPGVEPSRVPRSGAPTPRCFWRLLDEILERLERGGADLLLRRLAFDRDRLLGERVDARTVLRRRLLDGTKLE